MSEVTTEAAASSENVTEAVTNEPAAAEAVVTPIEKRLEKFKLKVDGEESEVEFDLNDKEGLTRQFQMAKAADKRIAAANTDRKKAFEILKAYEDGSLLKNHPKAREMAEALLLEQINEEMMDPKDKELRDYKSKLSKYEEREANDKKTLEQQANDKKENDLVQEFQKTIVTALEKSGLPKTPALAKRMAAIMSKNIDLGLKLTADDLVSEVKTETLEMFKSIIGDATGDQLIEMFGEDVAKKIRGYDVKKLKTMQNNVSHKPQVFNNTKQESGRPLTIEQWKEQTAQRIKG